MQKTKLIALWASVVFVVILTVLGLWMYFLSKSFAKRFRSELSARLKLLMEEQSLGTLSPKKELLRILENDEGIMVMKVFGKTDMVEINLVGISQNHGMYSKFQSLLESHTSVYFDQSKILDFATKQAGDRIEGHFHIQSTLHSSLIDSPNLITKLGLYFADSKVVCAINFYQKLYKEIQDVYLKQEPTKYLTIFISYDANTINVSYPVTITYSDRRYESKSDIFSFDYVSNSNVLRSSNENENIQEQGKELNSQIILKAFFATVYGLGDA